MKILIIGLSDNIGGIETFFHTYYSKIDLKKYKFDFATVRDTVAFGEEYIKNGSTVFRLPSFIKNPIKYRRALCKIIGDNKYDIVHINMLSAANIIPVGVAEEKGVRTVIVHSHNSGLPSGFLRKILHFINKYYLRKSRTIKIACGEKAGEWMFGNNSSFRIIKNAICLADFKYETRSRNEIRKKYGISKGDFLIGNVGRLCEQKNQVFLIDVLSKLDNNSIKLMLVGDGEYRHLIEDEAKKLGVLDRVIFVNNTSNVKKYYSAFDVFAFPSKFEGVPIAPVEAQANGLACLLSDCITDDVDQGNAIYLDTKTDKWAEKLLVLYNHRTYARKAFIREEYNIDKCYKELLGIYNKDIDLFVCTTYYHLLIAIIRSMRNKNKTDLVIEDFATRHGCIAKNNYSLVERLKKSNIFHEVLICSHDGIYDNTPLCLARKWFYIKRGVRTDFINFFQYNKIYVFGSSLLQKIIDARKIHYNVIEDGVDCYKNNSHLIMNNGLRNRIKRSLFHIYGVDGSSPFVDSIEVNNKKGLNLYDKKLVESPKYELFESLTANEQKTVLDVFSPSFDLDGMNNIIIIITQPLFEDGFLDSEQEKIDLYRGIMRKYDKDNVVLKVHPRETTDYSDYFKDDIKVLDKNFPIELLGFFPGVRIKRAITLSSTSINSLLNTDEKIFLGWDYLEKFKKGMINGR